MAEHNGMGYTNKEAGWSFVKTQSNAVSTKATLTGALSRHTMRIGQRLISLWEQTDGGYALGTLPDVSAVDNGEYIFLGINKVSVYQGNHGRVLKVTSGAGNTTTASTIMLNGQPLGRNSVDEIIAYQSDISGVAEFDFVVLNSKKIAVGRIGNDWYLLTAT